MGRLTKKKIDEIRRLLKEGFTQKEVAEKLHVGRGSVSKYAEEEPTGGEVPIPDSELEELEMLEREKKRHQVLMELDKLREEREGLPKRLEAFEEKLNKLEITLKAFEEDLERLRLRLKMQPDLGKLKCLKCGELCMAVNVRCISCGQEQEVGLWQREMERV